MMTKRYIPALFCAVLIAGSITATDAREEKLSQEVQKRLDKFDCTFEPKGDTWEIVLSGFEGLRKSDIKIVRKGNAWYATIDHDCGYFDFVLHPLGVQVRINVQMEKYGFQHWTTQTGTFFSGNAQVDIYSLKVKRLTSTSLTLTAAKTEPTYEEEVLALS